MSAKILDFPSIVADPDGVPACRCPRHELEALAERIRAHVDRADSLLVPVSDLSDVLDDVTATSARLLPPRQEARP